MHCTSAPADNSKRTQDWLKKNLMEVCEKVIWPPSSPACSPAEYIVRGVSKFRVRAQLHNLSMAQIWKIREVVGSLARSTVSKACKRFRSWIEDIVDADGSFIQ
jgi:hypothetical protein